MKVMILCKGGCAQTAQQDHGAERRSHPKQALHLPIGLGSDISHFDAPAEEHQHSKMTRNSAGVVTSAPKKESQRIGFS